MEGRPTLEYSPLLTARKLSDRDSFYDYSVFHDIRCRDQRLL